MILKNNYLLSRLVLYIFLMVVIVAGYALLVSGLVLYGSTFPARPLVIGLAIFVITVLVLPVRQKLQELVDILFLRGQRGYQGQVRQFQTELSNQVSISA